MNREEAAWLIHDMNVLWPNARGCLDDNGNPTDGEGPVTLGTAIAWQPNLRPYSLAVCQTAIKSLHVIGRPWPSLAELLQTIKILQLADATGIPDLDNEKWVINLRRQLTQ